MSFETYWLAVPLAGIALTVPIWLWLWLSRSHRHKAPARRAREIAWAYKGLADHLAGLDVPQEAAKAERESQRWLTHATTLPQTPPERERAPP